MKQKIIIKNFGPIKDVEMEIDDFTIFIGPQTSGKSTIAKSVFFFLSLRDDMFVMLSNNIELGVFKNSRAVDNNFFDVFLDSFKLSIPVRFASYWDSSNYNDSMKIQFWYSKNCFIIIKYYKKEFEIVFSNDFTSQILDVIKSLKYLRENILLMNKDKFRLLNSKELAIKESQEKNIFNELQVRINEIFGFDADLLFIPAGRSILAVISDQMQNIKRKNLDYLTRIFIDRINASKSLIFDSNNMESVNFYNDEAVDRELMRLANDLSKLILMGSYFNDAHFKDEDSEDGGDKIQIENGNYIKLLFASSGQQEAVWIIQMILLLILNKQKVFIVIEEPEAHLFPEAQKNIINLITLLANVNDNQVFITTHSPYLLTSLNNLVYAYQVGQKHPEKVSEIVNKQLWLKPDKLQAYFVGGKDNQGKIRSIIHPELQIIQTEEIDSASSINNEEYDLLFDLD
jgi:predicted ATP-dependent endonuclease of OLD family